MREEIEQLKQAAIWLALRLAWILRAVAAGGLPYAAIVALHDEWLAIIYAFAALACAGVGEIPYPRIGRWCYAAQVPASSRSIRCNARGLHSDLWRQRR